MLCMRKLLSTLVRVWLQLGVSLYYVYVRRCFGIHFSLSVPFLHPITVTSGDSCKCSARFIPTFIENISQFICRRRFCLGVGKLKVKEGVLSRVSKQRKYSSLICSKLAMFLHRLEPCGPSAMLHVSFGISSSDGFISVFKLFISYTINYTVSFQL